MMDRLCTLDDNDEFMTSMKAMHEEMLRMKNRLEQHDITPGEWRQWRAGYCARLDEARKTISRMREELSLKNADLERQKRERSAELNVSFEEYDNYLKTLADN